MPSWLETDWSRLFTLEMSLPEAVVRGTLVYLFLAWSYALDWLSYREQKRATLRSGRRRLHGAARDFVVPLACEFSRLASDMHVVTAPQSVAASCPLRYTANG